MLGTPCIFSPFFYEARKQEKQSYNINFDTESIHGRKGKGKRSEGKERRRLKTRQPGGILSVSSSEMARSPVITSPTFLDSSRCAYNAEKSKCHNYQGRSASCTDASRLPFRRPNEPNRGQKLPGSQIRLSHSAVRHR